MLIIGIVGPTGAGKSSVCRLLQQQGYAVIDGDMASRAVLQADSPLLGQLTEVFGADILHPDGSLNRRLLASRAFADANSTAHLNTIVHPAITQHVLAQVEAARQAGKTACFIEGAALLESGLRQHCDWFVAVIAPKEERLQRILARDGISREEVLRRMSAQAADSYYTKAAAVVIDNAEERELQPQVQQIIDKIRESGK